MNAEDHVERPWGHYRILDRGPGFQVKRLTVNPGAAISSQSHRHRAEHWVVALGQALVTVGDVTTTIFSGGTADVPIGAIHRIQNQTEAIVEIIEVQYGDDLSEEDITRFEDIYGRA
jgi:mannose-6-phosphate isomerase-like protein (cupin superfamily)